MSKLTRWVAIFAITLIASLVQAESLPPDQLVKDVSSEVLNILKNDKDIQNGDMNKVTALAEEKIVPHFNFERMSRSALGQPWKDATPAQQQAFVREFRTLTTRTYSSALSKYRDQSIKYMPFNAKPNDTEVQVNTVILQPGGPSIPVDYLLEKEADQWKVYDVIISGLSLTAAHRGEYTSEVHQHGLDELIRKLAEKNGRSPAQSS